VSYTGVGLLATTALMHVEGLVLPGARAADAAGDLLPEMLQAAATSLGLLFLMTATPPSRCCLSNLVLPVSSTSINFFEILFRSFLSC
jgi:hypothetical protein